MAIDASIYSQIRQPEAPNLLAQYGQMQQIQNGQQQNRLMDFKMQEAQRAQQDDMATREAVKGFGTDTTANANRLLSTGNLKAAQDYQKGNSDRAKTDAETDSKKIEAAHKRAELIGQGLGYLKDNPTIENATAVIRNFVQQGIMPADVAQQKIADFQRDPTPQGIQRLATMGYQGALSAKDQLPQYQTQNLGGNSRISAISPVTGERRTVDEAPITQTADNIASNTTSTENNKRSVGASYANAAAVRETANATRDAAKIKGNQDTEMKLADDYRAQSKGFKEVSDAYKQISATLDKATTSPAATLASATKFMKLLDPGSVVRESELGMALAATGVIDRLTNYHNTLLKGKVLTTQQAADFKRITGEIYKAAQGQQQAIDGNYKRQATQYGLRPDMIVQDLGQNAPSGKTVNFGDLK